MLATPQGPPPRCERTPPRVPVRPRGYPADAATGRPRLPDADAREELAFSRGAALPRRCPPKQCRAAAPAGSRRRQLPPPLPAALPLGSRVAASPRRRLIRSTALELIRSRACDRILP